MQKINDTFRQAVLSRPQTNGKVQLTQGVAGLPKNVLDKVIQTIKTFSDFNAGNDPHKEHDFGAVQIEGQPKIFWKIDYYPDSRCEFDLDSDWGEDENDLLNAYRIMTVMLASEY